MKPVKVIKNRSPLGLLINTAIAFAPVLVLFFVAASFLANVEAQPVVCAPATVLRETPLALVAGNGEILFANSAAAELYGVPDPAKIVGRKAQMFLPAPVDALLDTSSVLLKRADNTVVSVALQVDSVEVNGSRIYVVTTESQASTAAR